MIELDAGGKNKEKKVCCNESNQGEKAKKSQVGTNIEVKSLVQHYGGPNPKIHLPGFLTC